LVYARSGDTVADLAQRYGVSEAAIRAENPGIGDHLVAGERVKIPEDDAGSGVHWNTGGQATVTINDTVQRTRYHRANERASESALRAIESAERQGNPARAMDAAYQASQQRIDNRTETRKRLSRGGLELSKAVDQSHPPQFYEGKYRASLPQEATTFDVARKMAQGVARSNPRVDLLLKVNKALGPVGLVFGAYGSYKAIRDAADKPQAIAKEAGGWVGGIAGASWGAAGGVALAVALGSNPVGWGILAAGAIGGIAIGALGSLTGQWAGGAVYDKATAWLK
jgi:LysM repeat protein